MNLLPKKSWHVGNVENKERVFRDEQQERIKEEKLIQKRAIDSRQEYLASLRSSNSSEQFVFLLSNALSVYGLFVL